MVKGWINPVLKTTFMCYDGTMLYLSRKPGESVIINGDIEVLVEEVRGKTVKIGFRFPEKVSVLRREVFDRIEEENRKAMKTSESFVKSLS